MGLVDEHGKRADPARVCVSITRRSCAHAQGHGEVRVTSCEWPWHARCSTPIRVNAMTKNIGTLAVVAVMLLAPALAHAQSESAWPAAGADATPPTYDVPPAPSEVP